MPSIGLLMRMPFHVTCVCDGPVPRNDTVERVARPYCFDENRCVERQRVGHREGDVLLEDRRVEFRLLDADAFIGRRPQTGTSRMAMAPFPAPPPRAGVLRGFRHVGRRRLARRPQQRRKQQHPKKQGGLFSCFRIYFQQTLRGDAHVKFVDRLAVGRIAVDDSPCCW